MQSQTWDLQAIGEELSALRRDVETINRRQAKFSELIDEMMPIATEMLGVGAGKLGTLEQRGYLVFAKQMAQMLDKVVTSFTEEDLELLGDNLVSILNTARSVTQPEILTVVNEALDAISDGGEAKPKGLFGMLKTTRDEDTKKGLAVMLQVLKYVGRSASKMGPTGKNSRTKRLASMLAPSAPRSPQPSAARPAAPRRAAKPAVATPPPIPAAAKAPSNFQVPGFELTGEGFLADPSTWNRGFAEGMASQLGVQLSESHWALIEFVRKDFADKGIAPNVRRIGKLSPVTTKELYGLFPSAPAIYAARISGVSKPVGCI